MDGIVTSVLNSVLSQYVKKFNKDEVDLSVWKGEAKLTNVELKPEALDFLNLPIAIRIGFVGGIFLQVDWKHLNSKPARIELHDLRIVSGPKSKFEMTAEMEKEQELNEEKSKQQLLDTWETLTLVPQEDTTVKPDAGYTARMIEKVIDNIHVVVKKVHVRYEDNVNSRNFSFGIAISSLTAVTTNNQWIVEFGAQSKQFVHKFVSMEGFCVYLNTKGVVAQRDYLEQYFGFNPTLDTIFDGSESRQYIIRPTGLKLKVIMNKDIEKDKFSIPQIKIEGKMHDISLNLGQDQYTDLMSIVSNITIASSYGKYLSYKPKNTSIDKEPKKYWKWAIGCVVRDENSKRNLSWRKFAKFGVDRNKYVRIYLKRLNCEWEKESDKAENAELESIEKKYDYNDIIYFRKCAVAQLRVQSNNKPVILKSKMPKESSSVFSGWFGKKKKKKKGNKPTVHMTSHQKNYLYFQIGAGLDDKINYNTFGKDSNDKSIAELLDVENDEASDNDEKALQIGKSIDPSKLPKGYTQIQFDFDLKSASLALLDILEEKHKSPNALVGVTFEGISTNLNVRPMGSLLLRMALQNMELIDYYKSENMVTKSMIQRTDVLELRRFNKKMNLKELKPLLNIELEVNPLDGIADTKIYLRSLPITVDLHIPVFLRLGPFFVQQRQVDMHAFERAALLQLEALQNASKAALDDAVVFHKTIAIDAEFYGPTIMLREDPSNDKSTKLVVNLGTFSIKSAVLQAKEEKESKDEKTEESDEISKLKALKEEDFKINEETLKSYYDCFNVSVKDIKIYLDRDVPKNHLLTPLNMDSKVYSSIFPSSPELATIVLKAAVPKVCTKLASSDIRKMYFMMENLIVDSYNEQTAQNEFFKSRSVEIKEQEIKEEMKLESKESKLQTQEIAEEEYFDEKTKLELLKKVNVLLSVQIDDIQFSLVNDDHFDRTGESVPIIISNIGGTYLYLQQRKWDLTMEAGLKKVLIEDHVCDSHGMSQPYLMRTGYVSPQLLQQKSAFELSGLTEEQNAKTTEFFKLNLNMINSKSPVYKNRDMLVSLAAGDVIFYLRPETIYGLTEVLIKNVLPSVDSSGNKTKNGRKQSISVQSGIDLVGEAADKIRRERERKERLKREKAKEAAEQLALIAKGSQKRTAVIKMKIDIVFSSLQLYICAKQFNICKSSIEGFKLDLTMYPYSMDMDIALGNILLTDETYIADLTRFPDYKYKVIMGKMEKRDRDRDRDRDPLVRLALNMYNDVEMEYPGYGMKIDIGLKGMKFTFLNRFVDEMLKWLMNSALLKIPQLITDQLDKSELMAGHEQLQLTENENEDMFTIAEDTEIDEKGRSDSKETDEAQPSLPQMRIIIEKMELIVPKSSVNGDYIQGNLGRLEISNDVLNKEDNTRMSIAVNDATIATRFGADKDRAIPLFTQPSIVIILSKEFSDINIEFAQISMQLAQKQYEFLMELLSGNLNEEAQVSSRVYPQRQIAMEDVISEEQKERAKEAALAAGKEQLKKEMKITLKINKFSAYLLKQYGLEFDPLTLVGKDSLVGFGIDGLALNLTIGEQITVELTMDAMSLKDVSYDTIQNGVQEVYRDLIAFNSNFKIKDESDESNQSALTPVSEKQILYPFHVIVNVNQASNETSVSLKMFGLQFTFGSVLWTLLEFANINPSKEDKLPPVPEELNNFQLRLLSAGHVSQIALVDEKQRPAFAQKEVFAQDLADDGDENKEELAEAVMTLSINVQIRDTMVKLIRFPKLVMSPALVLQLDVGTSVKMDKATPLLVNASVSNIQAYQAIISVEADESEDGQISKQLTISVKDGVPKIIEPFDIKASIKQYQSVFDITDMLEERKSDAKGMKGTVEMAPMVVRLGYSDFDVLMSSLSAIAPPVLEEESKDESKDEGKDEGKNEKVLLKKQEKLNKEMEKQMKKGEELPDKGEMEFAIKIGNISVVFVNDKKARGEIPLAQFVIDNVGADIYSYKQSMRIAAQFGFYGNYWNNEIAEWEPMIETWSAKANILMNTECTFVQFLPDRVFNVSFTYSMVQSAMAAVEVLSKSTDNDMENESKFETGNEQSVTPRLSQRVSNQEFVNLAKNVKSHCLNNQTEFKLKVRSWCSDELTDNDQKTIKEMLLNLKKNVTNTISVDKMTRSDFDTYPIEIERAFKRKVGIEISLENNDNYEPFIVLATNQIRERTYYLKNKTDETDSLILQGTHEIIGGAKEICIHSPIQFVNQTELNLSLFGGSIDLYSNESAYCPAVTFIKQPTFDLVPITDENNDKRQFKVVEELPLSPYTEDASYPIHTKRDDGIMYSMMLHTKKIKNGERVLFSIDSIVMVENLLVSDLLITFIQNEKRDQLIIKPGQTKNAYSSYKSKFCELEMKQKGLMCKDAKVGKKSIEEMVKKAMNRWNKSSSATEEKKESNQTMEVGDKDRQRFDFVDSNTGSVLSVIGELTQTRVRGAVTLTFYVPYWIYDLTSLKLIPSENKTRKNIVAGIGKGKQLYLTGKDKKKEEIEPIMFNFKSGSSGSMISVISSLNDDKETKEETSLFSRTFPPDAVGSTGRINELYGKHPTRSDKLKYEYEVGVDINVILGPFRGLIKSIILVPRIILKNELKMKCALLVRQIKSDSVPEKYCQIFKIEENTTKPFWWVIPRYDKEYKRRYIQFKKDIENWQWSSFIPVNETSDYTMTIRHKNANMEPQLIKVNITSTGAAMYVTFKKADYQYPPYRIENRCLATRFRFCQQQVNLWEIVEPLKSVPYGWDDCGREDKRIIINIMGQSETYKYNIEVTTDPNKESFIKYKEKDGSPFVLHVAVQMFGPTKVLIISDFKIPNQEDSSMLKLNSVNLGGIFKDEKLVVQRRLKYLDSQIVSLDNKLNSLNQDLLSNTTSDSNNSCRQRLIIQVVEARNLVQTGVFSGQADPYIELALHSKQSFKKQQKPKHFTKTKVMKNTRNPVWNKEFIFEGNEFDFYALGLDVKDSGIISDTFMGGATIKLTGLLQHPGKTMDQWIKLKGTQQTSRLTKNGDVHLRITFAKSESEAINHEIVRSNQEKSIYRTVQMRVLDEIRQREDMDPDLLPKQNRHRIIVKLAKNLYGKCFDKKRHKLFFIVRCGNESRRIGFEDNLFDNDNDRFAIFQDFFISEKWILNKIKMELWVKTVDIDGDEEEKSEALYDNHNTKQSMYEFLGLFTLPRQEFEEESKTDRKTKPKSKNQKDASTSNSQYDYNETEYNFQNIRFVTKNINLSSQVNKYLATMELTVSWTIAVADTSSIRPTVNIRALMSDIGLSVMDASPKEILYISFHDIDVLIKQSLEATTINFLLDNFQIDVQRYSARYCSLLVPEPVALEDRKAFVHIAINLANIADADNLMVIQYFSLLIQKFQLNIEEKLLWDLFSFGAEFAASYNSNIEYSESYAKQNILYNSQLYLELVPPPPTKFFFKGMIIQPLAIDFSLSVDSGSRPSSVGENPAMKLVMLVINTIINMVGNQDQVALKLNALAVDDAFGDMSTLFVPIIQHYRNQGLAEAYKFIGGMDIIGNPVQLVGNLGTGVKDFFYEPINGISESPDAFVRGLGKGTGSLVSGVIGGLFGSVSKVTSTLGKIATDATFDEDAIQERRIGQSKSEPAHVGDGLAKGGMSIVKGLWGGVSGLVTAPVKEVKRKGIKGGLASGIGKGVAGLLFKPVAGVLDAATNITAGIANTPDALLQKNKALLQIQRRRLPRALQKGTKLSQYNKKKALGSLIVWSLDEQGLDGRQLEGKSKMDIINMRQSEQIIFQQMINDGQKLICGTNKRFFSVNILKTVYVKENDTDTAEIAQIHSIWKAIYGIKDSKSNSVDVNGQTDVTRKVKNAFKKTSALHTLPIKQFQPMNSSQMFGDPAPNQKKVLKIVYTSTAITEKSALSSLFNDVLDTVTFEKDSSNMKDFDCLFSARIIHSVQQNNQNILIKYHQYFQPSQILKSSKKYNERRINPDAPKHEAVIECYNPNEASKLFRKINKYLQKLNPQIIHSSIGYATNTKDCTKRLQELVDLRDLVKLQRLDNFAHHFAVKEDANDHKKKYTPTLTVTYQSKLGKRTKSIKNREMVELD